MDVGRITARLDAIFDDDAFDKFDRRYDSTRRDAKKGVTAHLDAKADTRQVDKYNRAIKDTDNRHKDLVRGTGRLKAGMGSFFFGGTGLAAGAAALYGVSKAGKAALDAFGESERVTTQTGAVLKSTGNIANVTADDVSKLADRLSKMSGVDDEAIASGENLILTFKNIRNRAGENNDIFDQTTKAALDMSVAMGTDMRSASMALGKALNDPATGMSRLSRMGVTFTEQQKEQVAAMQEAGDVAGAQKLILGELRKEFGGSAKAAGGTMTGALNKMKVAVGNVAEWLGGKLAPVVTKVANFINHFAQSILGGGDAADGLRRKLAPVGAVFSGVGNVIRNVAGFIGKVISDNRKTFESMGRTVVSIARSVIGAVKKIGDGISDVFSGNGVGKDIRKIISVLLTFGAAVLKVARDIIAKILPGIITAFKGLATIVRGVVRVIAGILTLDFKKIWSGVKDIFSGAIKAIGGLLRALIAPFRMAFSAIGDIVGKGIRAVIGFVSRLPGDVWRFLKRTISNLGKFVSEFVRDGANGAKKFVKRVIDFVSDLPARVWNWLKRTLNRLGDFVSNLVSSGVNGAKRFISKVIGVIADLPGKVGGFLKKTVGNVVDFVGDMARNGAKAAGDFIERIANGLIKLPGRMAKWASTAAVTFVRALINGIRHLPQAIVDIFKGIGGIIADIGRSIANWLNDNTPLGDKVSLPGPLPDFRLPALSKGGKVGPSLKGAQLFIAGEGEEDEWVISQEGDRRKNIGWAKEALEKLTGRKVELHRTGKGKKKKKAPPSHPAAEVVGSKVDRRIDESEYGIRNFERDISRLQREYDQSDRKYNQSEESIIVEHDDGSVTIDSGQLNKRKDELDQLIAKRKQIKKRIEDYKRSIKKARSAYKAAIARLKKALRKKGRSKGDRRGYQSLINRYNGRMGELADLGKELDLDIKDENLDIEDLQIEKDSLDGKPGEGDASAPASPVDTDNGSGGDGGVTPTGTTPEELAAAVRAQVESFNAVRQDLFSSFGSNFVRSGAATFGGNPNDAVAGVQYFGARGSVQTAENGAQNGTLGGDVNLINNFAAPPPDPHPWAKGAAAELGALG